jgi:hypothetical protein
MDIFDLVDSVFFALENYSLAGIGKPVLLFLSPDKATPAISTSNECMVLQPHADNVCLIRFSDPPVILAPRIHNDNANITIQYEGGPL